MELGPGELSEPRAGELSDVNCATSALQPELTLSRVGLLGRIDIALTSRHVCVSCNIDAIVCSFYLPVVTCLICITLQERSVGKSWDKEGRRMGEKEPIKVIPLHAFRTIKIF